MKKRIKCVRCEYTEAYDPMLDIKDMMCPSCGYTNTLMVTIPTVNVDKRKEPKIYSYLASDGKKEYHDVKTSKEGEIEATTEIQAYHKLKEKYKDVIIVRSRGKNETK